MALTDAASLVRVDGLSHWRPELLRRIALVSLVLIVGIVVSPMQVLLPSTYAEVLATDSIPLAAGWNLISLPLVPSSSAPSDVFAPISGYYTLVYAYDAGDAGQPWRRYCPTDPPYANTLTQITEEMGLWVYVTEATALTVSGVPAASGASIALRTGWNLVGHLPQESLPILTALDSLAGRYDQVYAYDAFDASDPWKRYGPDVPSYANDLTEMRSGRGYWIHATSDCTLSLPEPSPTPTPGDTPTSTPSNTPTPGNTPTSTPSNSPTPGSTPTPTAMPTNTPTPPPNMLSNGDFETGTLSGWDVEGDPAASTSEAHAGSWSAHFAVVDSKPRISVLADTVPGTEYKVTAWVKIVSETGSDWGGFFIWVYDGDWEEIGNSGWLLTSTHGSDWFKVAVPFTATTDPTRIYIGYKGGLGRTMVVHVDDVMLFPVGANQLPQISVALSPTSMDGLPQIQEYSLVGDDADGAIVRVAWEFGDGTRSLEWAGTRRLASPGSYVATVRVADDDGAVVVKTIEWTATDDGFPSLMINTPAESRLTTDAATLLVSGAASASVTGVFVSTDRGYACAASGTNTWSASVSLAPGVNRILVQAHDADGSIVTSERLVKYTPGDALTVTNLAESASSLERWEMLEVSFDIENSAATHSQFPYDPAPPPGLEWMDGINVDGLFTPDNWQTVYRRPAFLNQRYERALKGNEEWLYPTGDPVWTVRFAPPEVGDWEYRVEVTEAEGTAESEERAFAVTAPTDPINHGPVRVAPLDTRYFEYADGTPFLGTGYNWGPSRERCSYDVTEMFDAVGEGNEHFFRWWIPGRIWGSAWQPWRSRTVGCQGYLPYEGLTVERGYANGLAALKLDDENPLMFQGWNTGHAGLIPGRTYRVRVRWRTEDVTGPAETGQSYGVCAKFAGWPEPGETGSIPTLISHVHGDTPWHVAEADFVAEGDLLPNLALILENTTGGAAYVDEVDLYEVLGDGALGLQLLLNPRFNSHLTFEPRLAAGIEAGLTEAAARGMYFKLVISEKHEYLVNHLGPDGLPDRNGGHFFGGEGSPTYWLHQAYWRHIFARFGAYRSVHSWELVNEGDPHSMAHFHLADALATRAAADGNPRLASTSTWSGLTESYWKDPDSASIPYVDFHVYVRGTGWIEPKDELANDSARFFSEYDQAAVAADFGKPVVWGEQGIDGTEGSDNQEPLLDQDADGVSLHKMTWARCGSGGVYPLYWYTEHILNKSLHGIYGAWDRFMEGIPLTNGRYDDAGASASHPDLRVFGQKDLQDGRAHLWIDNRQHTWRAVVDGMPISPVSGTVSVAMQSSQASYEVTWYDTGTGEATGTETLSADGEGTLVLTVSDLNTDVAARIVRVQTQ